MQTIFNLKQINTPRLLIRPLQIGDEIEINRSVNHSKTALIKWMPWASDTRLEITRVFVETGLANWKAVEAIDFPMVVIHKLDQRIIGVSGYNDGSKPHDGVYEIGYWCDIDYQGQGYVTEYVNGLTRYALIGLSASKVVIRADIRNIKSINVAERLNFIRLPQELPSKTLEDATDCVFVCSSSNMLPPLEVAWR